MVIFLWFNLFNVFLGNILYVKVKYFLLCKMFNVIVVLL